MANDISRMKQLIEILNKANEDYYGNNESTLSDHEFDKLMDELDVLEKKTGIVFSNSPNKKVGSSAKSNLAKVKHTKPMLSAKKTKALQEIKDFINSHEVVLSWKLDGLTIVLRYEKGRFVQALTRGEKGLFGEDITHTVKYLRGVPKTVKNKDYFEVRGEGVVSYADFALLNRNASHTTPRNMVSGAVRANNFDRYKLEKIDFIAFDLICDNISFSTKEEQLNFLSEQGFNVVENEVIESDASFEDIKDTVEQYKPKDFYYPVDGLIFEFDDIAFGKSLGATDHHENRLMAFKWADDTYETVFRGVEITTGKNGLVGLTAIFDEVIINGLPIKKADIHSYSNFEKLEFGIGDKIKVYLANMVVPEIEDNLDRTNTYKIKERCPCCGAKLETKTNNSGSKHLYCPNEDCISKNAYKIARYCDSEAMNIEGLSISRIETLLTYGAIKSCVDLYNLDDKKDIIFDIPNFGISVYEKIIESVNKSRTCHLYQFLMGLDIPLIKYASAKAIDEYFYGSYIDFKKAIKEGFHFFHIAGVSEGLDRNIHSWFKENENFYKPLEKVLNFYVKKRSDTETYEIDNKNISFTGIINNMSGDKLKELISLLGANAYERINDDTDILLVGKNPDKSIVAEAFKKGINIITETEFIEMLNV